MATPANGDKVVVTPIFWAPPGYSFSGSYKSVIEQYCVMSRRRAARTTSSPPTPSTAAPTGRCTTTSVAGTPIHAHNPLPPQECTPDPGPVYKDHKPYTGCVDDDQVTAEVTTASAHLPKDLGHMYLLFTPKQLESCIYSDAEAVAAGGNACTVSSSATDSAYCAYHSWATHNTNEIYGEMPYPIYGLRSDAGACAVSSNPDSPNNSVDADVEVSPTSHEMSEAFTDPNAVGPDQLGGWYDPAGFENGDECAYIYGPLVRERGTPLQPDDQWSPLPDPGGVQQRRLLRNLRPGGLQPEGTRTGRQEHHAEVRQSLRAARTSPSSAATSRRRSRSSSAASEAKGARAAGRRPHDGQHPGSRRRQRQRGGEDDRRNERTGVVRLPLNQPVTGPRPTPT